MFRNLFKTHKKMENTRKDGTSQTLAIPTRECDIKSEIHNLLIVDESGSMCHLCEATISGINETLETIRQAQKQYAETQTHYVSIVVFDSPGEHHNPVRTLIDDVPIEQVGTFSNYHPCGCTPLYDAVGSSLTHLYNKVKDKPDATAVVTIITDGMENSSCDWNLQSVSALIKDLTEKGWTFSYMGSEHDVTTVTHDLHITNVIKFAHTECGSNSTWDRERSAKMAFYSEINSADYRKMSMEERVNSKRRMSANYYTNRETPRHIEAIKSNEVYVFGTDVNGMHQGYCGRKAVMNFGAIAGQNEGMMGQSYAIPTGNNHLIAIAQAAERFRAYAAAHPERRFLVTEIGCGGAGFTPEIIAPMFQGCVEFENVALPRSFWNALGIEND